MAYTITATSRTLIFGVVIFEFTVKNVDSTPVVGATLSLHNPSTGQTKPLPLTNSNGVSVTKIEVEDPFFSSGSQTLICSMGETDGYISITIARSNDVLITANELIPLKYVGDTGIQSIPCIVTDMIDQGVMIADGRVSDEDIWEGEGIIISPGIPAGTVKLYDFTDPDLSPADNRYEGDFIVNFTESLPTKRAIIVVTEAPE